MKNLITLFLIVASFSTYAKNLTLVQQEEIVREAAKQVRKQYYLQGHEVASTGMPLLMNKKDLIEFYFNYKNEESLEEELTEKEISSLFKCHYSKSCALWFFGSSAEYMGGFGAKEHFILLNKKSGSYRHISYISYAE